MKPKLEPTRITPFCLVDIRGNIAKCAGCHGNLRDGPPDGYDFLDGKICVRHKERDHVWVKQRNEWIPKFDNKHYHVSKGCILSRNSHFHGDNILMNFLEIQQVTFTVKYLLNERLY